MKYIFFILWSLILLIPKVQSAEPTYFYSPGIKFGYQFGENGGFVYGVEFSIMRTVDYFPKIGGTICIDYCNENVKFHVGAQTATIVGIDFGPTIYFTPNKTLFGYSFGVYGLVLVIPYYEYSKIFDEQNFSINQAGAFLKYPIQSRPYRFNLSH